MNFDNEEGWGMCMEKDGGVFKELDELVERLGREAGKPGARGLEARGYAGMVSVATRTASETIERSGGKVVKIVRTSSTTETMVPAEDEAEERSDGLAGGVVPVARALGSMDLFDIHAESMTPLQRKAWMESAAFEDPRRDPCGDRAGGQGAGGGADG